MIFVVYMLILLTAVVASLFVVWIRVRQLRHRAVVQTLAVIVGQNLPLPEALRAAARAEKRALRRVFTRMAARLEEGHRLSTSLRVAMLSCPAHITGALEGAERGGTLPTVLRSLAAEVRGAPAIPAGLGAPTLYSLVMLVIVPAILAFFFLQLFPKLVDILRDYRLELPGMTQRLVDVFSSPQSIGGALLLLFVIIVLGAVQTSIARNFLVRMPGGFQWFTATTDGLAWWTPLVRRVVEARALSRQLPLLHAGLRAGHDLPAAARQATCVDANYHARRRMTRWAALLETGADPAGAARRLGFPQPFVRALGAAGSGADLPAGLQYLVSYYRSLTVHWQRVLLSAVMPLVVLVWGLCVGFIVVATFLPLVAMLQAVADSVY